MSQDRLQLQRFELKYIVPEGVTEPIREFVRPYLCLDEYGRGSPDYSYRIHSVYLDSDSFALYWDTMKGAKNRYKIRLRFYDENPDSPIYFEIKRRSDEAILKQRAAVRRAAVQELLGGRFPVAEHLIVADGKQLAALQRFSELMIRTQARPKTHVAYSREAWVSVADNSVRVTIDRDVRSEPEPTLRLGTEMNGAAVRVFGPQAVVEIKYTGRFPNWFRELVQVFGLQRCSAAKYAEGVTLLGEHHFSRSQVSMKLPKVKPIESAEQAGYPNLLEAPI